MFQRIIVDYHVVVQSPGKSDWRTSRSAQLGTEHAQIAKPLVEAFGPGTVVLFGQVEFPAFAWPGGYQLFYGTADGGVLCPRCVNEHQDRCVDKDDEQFLLVYQEVNYEDNNLTCDHCGSRIPSAYGEQDD